MYKKMCNRVVAAVFIVIAVVLYVIMAIYGEDFGGVHSKFVAHFIKPFEIMIPILAVGALIKFLICGIGDDCGCGCDEPCDDNNCCQGKKE